MKKVELGKHLMYEEMLEAAKLIFDEQTESQDIVDFLVALSEKERRPMKWRHSQL